jgi:hypothetical protein
MNLAVEEVRYLDRAFCERLKLLGRNFSGGFDTKALLEARAGILKSPEEIEEEDENPHVLTETQTPDCKCSEPWALPSPE